MLDDGWGGPWMARRGELLRLPFTTTDGRRLTVADVARLVLTAAYQLQRSGARFALCTMCVGVGQGVALILERA